ncbi:MAG: hypothetical protein Q7N95_04705 [Alphaproteobacteria bacterium]|nr:hypothetical protein [Alphaproteobacteria bacterium]
MNDIHEMNDAELQTVAGGMTCEAAHVVASIHRMTAQALTALGQPAQAAYYGGMAIGTVSGACGY